MIIWLASYPKSGNTLLRSILATYLYSNDGIVKFDYIYKIKQFPAIEDFKKLKIDMSIEKEVFDNYIEAQKIINKDKKIKFIKTHSSLVKINNSNFTDLNNSLGAIYIVRDPRNVVTSFAHHYNLNIDEAINVMTDPKRWLVKTSLIYQNFLGSWKMNYNSWKQMKNRVLFVKYEDLVEKKKTTMIKIFKFIQSLGVDGFKPDMIKLNKVIKTSQFQKMQELEKKGDFKEAVVENNTHKKKIFFKFGPKNNWRNILDPKRSKKIEEAFNKEMIELGYIN